MEDFNLDEQTTAIEAAIEAGEFDKAVELVNAVPEDEITPELREKALANIEEKRAEAEPPPEKDITEGVPPETIEAIKLAEGNGSYGKMVKLVKALTDDHPYKVSVLAKSAELKEIAQKAKAEKPAKPAKPAAKPKPVRKAKEITSAELLEDYKALYDKFTAYEAQQKKAKKAFRHCVVARRRIEVHSMNFRRNCR